MIFYKELSSMFFVIKYAFAVNVNTIIINNNNSNIK